MFKATLLSTALLCLAGPALADSWTVDCPSNTPGPWPGSMFCSEGKMLAFTPPTPATEMILTIKAPSTHCSQVTYLINRLPGSSEPIATLKELKPGERKRVKLGADWNDGENFLTISAIGHVGGCNTGVLGSWGAETAIAPR